jgi:transposase InsO family protein
MVARMNAKLVTDALNMAIWQRQPKPGLVVHSDRGSQYASKAHRRLPQPAPPLGAVNGRVLKEGG